MINLLNSSKGSLSNITKFYPIRSTKFVKRNGLDKCRIYGISDLHLEFYPDHLILWNNIKDFLPNADVLVLAGDIGIPSGDSLLQYELLLNKFKSKYENIVMIAGNHEYYRTINYDRESILNQLKTICENSRVIFLDNSSTIINGVKFIGTTLWSLAHPDAKINDFGKVFPSSIEYNEEFLKCKDWLKLELETISKTNDSESCKTNKSLADPTRCVVITHHMPTSKLCHPKFAQYPILNTAFYTDLLDEIDLSKVDLWFCGHTHEYKVYEHLQSDSLHKTIFVVNPYGYPHEMRDTYTTSDTYDVVKILPT